MPENFGQDHPGVRIPPPLIFGGCLLVGLWIDSAWFSGLLAPVLWTIAGAAVAVLGLIIILLSVPSFFKHDTSIEPWKPASVVITDGIYRYSRNPIYLGMAIGSTGMAIAAQSWPGLIGVAIAVLIVRFYVITREERYLKGKFGEQYQSYMTTVRRWL